MRLLVTGGAGFIGSAFVRQAVAAGERVCVVDKLTYAGDLSRLADIAGRFLFHRADICDAAAMRRIFRGFRPEAVAHFAAESHVDRSIADAAPFIETNVAGTQVLLDASHSAGVRRFLQVSTDEVYGEIARGNFHERSPLNPNSPYAVSKAAADMLARAYQRTYGLAVIVVRPSNNYGPRQFPEKLIPVIITQALAGKPVPVYARGLNVREWLHVDDCCRAIRLCLRKGAPGAVYNIGSGQRMRNIDTVKTILGLLGKPESLIRFVADRPGHDLRYALDSSLIRRKLGWKPRIDFPEGLKLTVQWYCRNPRSRRDTKI